MERRPFLKLALLAGASAASGGIRSIAAQDEAPSVALTFDDFNIFDVPALSGAARNRSMLDALQASNLRSAVFVTARNVESAASMRLLESWNEAGHLIGNHTYTHPRYSRTPFDDFAADLLRCDGVLRRLSQFQKWFRFPYLDEGTTAEHRDRMRAFLAAEGYRNGHVTIDASDWYVDGRLRTRLAAQPNTDVSPYRQFYLDHIWERAQFYDGLSRQILGRSVRHVLLLHHNVLNGMFLTNLIQMFKTKGWKVIDAQEAFTDSVFTAAPDVLPAGQSLVWSLAKQTGRFDDVLRYPGEDGTYEAAKMDALGL